MHLGHGGRLLTLCLLKRIGMESQIQRCSQIQEIQDQSMVDPVQAWMSSNLNPICHPQTLCCVAEGLKRHNRVFILWAQPHGELAVMLLRDDTRDTIDRIVVFHWSNWDFRAKRWEIWKVLEQSEMRKACKLGQEGGETYKIFIKIPKVAQWKLMTFLLSLWIKILWDLWLFLLSFVNSWFWIYRLKCRWHTEERNTVVELSGFDKCRMKYSVQNTFFVLPHVHQWVSWFNWMWIIWETF